MNIDEIYRLIDERKVQYYNATCFYYEHIKTGAKVIIIKNKDRNKVCTVGFKTLSFSSSNGLAHLTEHCVTRGSTKYPQSEPRRDLQMKYNNLYINGMTYPDKTLFVISAIDMEAFDTSIDVIMDGLFYPKMYENKEIFMQEGWHIDEQEGKANISGIVINEMVQHYSDSQHISYINAMKSLFPDSPYQYDTAGDPYEIVKTTYDDMLTFHKEHYQPSNAYIYLYGDFDVNSELIHINNYLKQYKRNDTNKNLILYPSKPVLKSYNSSDYENKKLVVSYNYRLEFLKDPVYYYAIEFVLIYVLKMNKPKLLHEFLKNNLHVDITYEIIKCLKVPVLQVRITNANLDSIDKITRIFESFFEKMKQEPVDLQIWNGLINKYEYSLNQNSKINNTIGLRIQHNIFDAWIYDEDPFIYINIKDMLHKIRDIKAHNHLSDIIETFILNNKMSNISIVEDKKYEYNLLSKFSTKEIKREYEAWNSIKNQTEQCKTDNLMKLDIEELKKDDYDLCVKEGKKKIDKMNFICYIENSLNKIANIGYKFEVNKLDAEFILALGLLSDMIFVLDNNKYNRNDMANFIFQNTYKCDVDIQVYINAKNIKDYKVYLEFNIKLLNQNIEKVTEFLFNVLESSITIDLERFESILKNYTVNYRKKIISNGIDFCILSNTECMSDYGKILNNSKGLGYIQLLENIQSIDLIEKIEDLKKILFTRDNILCTCISSDIVRQHFIDCSLSNTSKLHVTKPYIIKPWVKVDRRINEVIKSNKTRNCFVRQGNFANLGYQYNGIMLLLEEIIEKEYLWKKVRLGNGTYNTKINFFRSGEICLISYMDMNIDRTDMIFKEIPQFLIDLRISDLDFNNYKASVIKKMNCERSCEEKGEWFIKRMIKEEDTEQLKQQYLQIKNAEICDLKRYSVVMKKILDNSITCTV